MNCDDLDVTPEEVDLLSARDRKIMSGQCPNGCGELRSVTDDKYNLVCPGCHFATALTAD